MIYMKCYLYTYKTILFIYLQLCPVVFIMVVCVWAVFYGVVLAEKQAVYVR